MRALIGLIAAAFAAYASADTVQWTGAGDGRRWADPANWSAGARPAAGDEVLILPGTEVLLDVAVPPLASLTAGRRIDIAPGGVLAMSGAASFTAPPRLSGGSAVGGSWTVSGVIETAARTTSVIDGTSIAGEVRLAGEYSVVRLLHDPRIDVLRLAASGATLGVQPGAVLNGRIISTSGAIELDGPAGTLTLGPDSVVTVGLQDNPQISIAALGIGGHSVFPGAMSLVLLGRLEGPGTSPHDGLTLSLVDLENQGVISWAAGTLSANLTGSYRGGGAVAVSHGRLQLRCRDWTTMGSMQFTSQLELANLIGDTDGASLARLSNQTDSPVLFSGVIDNRNHLLEFSPAMGVLTAETTTFLGGSLRTRAGGRLQFGLPGSPHNITLDGVEVLDEVQTGRGGLARLILKNGAVVPAVTSSGYLNIVFDQTVPWDFPVNCAIQGGDGVYLSTDPPTIALHGTPASSLTVVGLDNGVVDVCNNVQTDVVLEGLISVQGRGSVSLGGRTLTQSGPLRFDGPVSVGLHNLVGPVTEQLSFAGTGGRIGFTCVDAPSSAQFGHLTIPTGVAATITGQWTVQSITVQPDASLEFAGQFPSSNLQALENRGVVTLSGIMDIGPEGFELNATRGSIRCTGTARLRGGSLRLLDGQAFIPNANAGRLTLLGVNVLSELVLPEVNTSLYPRQGTRLVGARLSAPETKLIIDPGDSIDFPVIFDGAPGATRSVVNGRPGVVTLSPSGALEARGVVAAVTVAAAGFTFDVRGVCRSVGQGGLLGLYPTTLVNFNASTRTLTGGRWEALGGGSLDLMGLSTVLHNEADVTLESPVPDFLPLISNAGTLRLGSRVAWTAPSSVTAFLNSGVLDLAPGARFQLGSAARTASFTQTASGTLVCRAAPGPGPQAPGALRVFGRPTLAGTLSVLLDAGFSPDCGGAFPLVDGDAAIVGRFDVVHADDPPLPLISAVLLSGSDVVLQASPLADFDRSGFVDFFDYLEFAACFEAGDCPDADVNRDGFLDFFDYLDFVASFEEGC